MPKIDKNTFHRELGDRSIDKEKLQESESFRDVDVDAVDLNKDGEIKGTREMNKLFKAMDHFDRDGSSRSMNLGTERNPTRPGEMMDAVRKLADGSRPAPAPVAQIERLQKQEFIDSMRGKAVDSDVIQEKFGISNSRLNQIDRDRDGRVFGDSEMGRLFREIDRADSNGDAGSINAKVGGDLTPAGKLAEVAQLNAVDFDPSVEWRQNIIKAATDLVENYGQNYGTDDAWINIDPNHSAPANRPLEWTRGRWKCNLFLGNVLYHAGMKTPFYGDGATGNYPNANQVFKWSDQENRRYGTKERFEMKGELAPLDIQDLDERRRRVQELLATAEPGDLILVDHPGTDVSDGGHCRVVIENNIQSGGSIRNAQASSQKAEIQNDSLEEFTGEEHIWILRANKPRSNFQAGRLSTD